MPAPSSAPPPGDSLEHVLASALADRKSNRRLRTRKIVRPIDAVHVEIDGRRYVNFCSNNYLGLTHHPAVIEAVAKATRDFGAGSAASGLISGYTHLHESAERALAAWKGTESAVLLPSGYQANHAAIQTIAGAAEATGRRVRFLLDKLAHASLIDAIRASGQPVRVFPHNDMAKLERLLIDADADELQVVVTESIFSMDGDAADLRRIVELKRAHPFTLLLDEAHGSGVYGPAGSGYASEIGLADAVDVFVVTLSKSLGTSGGGVCASKGFCESLINFGRAYIYSTSVPPSVATACEAAIGVMRDEPERQQRVRALAKRVRGEFAEAGFKFPEGDSPILPLIIGKEEKAIAMAERLRDKGILVLPVRPPTVPQGSSRLRLTLSSAHTDDEVEALVAALIYEMKSKA